MSRRKSRILAFQALYSHDVGGVPVEDLVSFPWVEPVSSAEGEAERTFARLLLAGAVERVDELDEVIKAHLSARWTLERINKVSLEILRLAVYEMMYQGSVDRAVVIDEAVKIAKNYGEEGSFKFINAVLDNISRQGARVPQAKDKE